MATVNIVTYNDADFYREFVLKTADDVPVDLSGASMEMKLRRHAEDQMAVLHLSMASTHFVLTDAVNGKFTLRIPQSELLQIGLGDFDHSNIMTQGGLKTRIWGGVLTNNAGPTR